MPLKDIFRTTLFFLLLICFFSCTQSEKQIHIDDISPWCVVSFDSLERNPVDRIAMLKEMGFSKYGYNWREKHLPIMQEEFALAEENDMQIVSIFLWLNAKRDSIGKLSPLNEKLFNNLEDIKNKPDVWVSFSDNYFNDLTHEESVNLAIEYIKFVKSRTDQLGVKLALYNHHGWFGNPDNQIEIIQRMSEDSLRMVYNFHHAHEYLDNFPAIVKRMKPYLSYVNINGMRKEGPKILTIGEGDYEFDMVRTLMDEGYNGPWGILGHIETEDVQKVLERNMKGLESLNAQLLNKEGD